VHWKAHPIFQPGAVIVNVGLVQLPDSCVGPRSRRAGDVAVVAVEEVEDCPVADVVEEVDECPFVDVVVDECPVVGVVVEEALVPLLPAAVVVVALDPDGGGST
jgi:hypothetical protein